MNILKLIKSTFWKYHPREWVNWLYYYRSNIRNRFDMFRLWTVLPWENNSRCSICAGSKRHPKYGDECDHCGGTGKTERWSETKISKIFKFFKLRIDNKIKKLY